MAYTPPHTIDPVTGQPLSLVRQDGRYLDPLDSYGPVWTPATALPAGTGPLVYETGRLAALACSQAGYAPPASGDRDRFIAPSVWSERVLSGQVAILDACSSHAHRVSGRTRELARPLRGRIVVTGTVGVYAGVPYSGTHTVYVVTLWAGESGRLSGYVEHVRPPHAPIGVPDGGWVDGAAIARRIATWVAQQMRTGRWDTRWHFEPEAPATPCPACGCPGHPDTDAPQPPQNSPVRPPSATLTPETPSVGTSDPAAPAQAVSAGPSGPVPLSPPPAHPTTPPVEPTPEPGDAWSDLMPGEAEVMRAAGVAPDAVDVALEGMGPTARVWEWTGPDGTVHTPETGHDPTEQSNDSPTN